MYNPAEIYIIWAILLSGGCIICLIGHFVEKYLHDDEPRLKHPAIDYKKLAEFEETWNRR